VTLVQISTQSHAFCIAKQPSKSEHHKRHETNHSANNRLLSRTLHLTSVATATLQTAY
jgi:hypothetical protein